VPASRQIFRSFAGAGPVHTDGDFLDFRAPSRKPDLDGQDILTQKIRRRFVKRNMGGHFERQARW
jgi:hypothetical protein